jgi:MFS transporter, PAT family, beta-lactamase induction signal transducer AmpG
MMQLASMDSFPREVPSPPQSVLRQSPIANPNFPFPRLHAPWLASCIVGGLCLICCLALAGVLLLMREARKSGLAAGLGMTFKDLRQLIQRPVGVLVLVLCFLPIGAGAAPLSALADEWHASANKGMLITAMPATLRAGLGPPSCNG